MNKKFLAILGGGLITVSAVGTILSTSLTFQMSNKITDRISVVQDNVTTLSQAMIEEKKTDDDPQYVTIASQYPILDTSNISDAYITQDSSKLTTPEDKETLQLASELLKKITTDKMSLYEKELEIHDWMATNIVYEGNNLSSIPTGNGATHTPYGVLKYKKAVCVGYATTFKLLMNMLGADCMVEHDNDFSHSWNVVKLDDGQWYIVDNYYDSCNNPNSKVISHANFNLTNDIFTIDHAFQTENYPVAAGTKYSYAAQNAVDLKDIKQLPKLLSQNYKKKQLDCYYKVSKDVDCNYIAAVINGASLRLGEAGSINAEYLKLPDDTVILTITFIYMDDNLTADESSYPKLTDELDKYFGQTME
ncbi:MAG: transglutaminase domain-containing protein [bacterium]|nr:transglutaminase domain-containing protein [bacterium]